MDIVSWLSGDLSRKGRTWSTIAPFLLITAYFISGLLLFATYSLRHGMPQDRELALRAHSIGVPRWIEHYFAWVTRPIYWVLLRSDLPASSVTALTLILSLAASLSLGIGRFSLGGWLLLGSGFFDFWDGRIARGRQEATAASSAFNATIQRYCDALIFGGLAYYYAVTRHEPTVMLLTLAAWFGSFMTHYTDVRADSLGIVIDHHRPERPGRILYLGLALVLAPLFEVIYFAHDVHPVHWLAVIAIVTLAVLSNAATIQRTVSVLKELRAAEQTAGLPAHRHRQHSRALPGSALAGIAGTTIDFALFKILVSQLVIQTALPAAIIQSLGHQSWTGIATLAGCVAGGVLNFWTNRAVIFRAHALPAIVQAKRYALVSLTGALLNGGGVTLLMCTPALRATPNNLIVAWVSTRVFVYIAWNYPLWRSYVFPLRPAQPHASPTEVTVN